MNIEALLESRVGPGRWKVQRTLAGLSGESFIASSGQQTVFVKLNADVPYLQRLSELQVTPRVIADGEESGVRFVIQEISTGAPPQTGWFRESIGELAKLIRKYHKDEVLNQALRRDGRVSTCGTQIAELEEEIRGSAGPQNAAITNLVARLAGSRIEIPDRTLVPIHPDPNKNNLLVEDGRILIVDWDGITLSDPLRDVGLLCYWYLPEGLWPAFFEETGIAFDARTCERLYWWAAARSLAIHFWFSHRGRGEAASRFLEDAQAAIEKKPNPHGEQAT